MPQTNGPDDDDVPFYEPTPNEDNAENRLKVLVEEKFNVKFADYEEWYQWTCDHYPQFWETVLRTYDIKLHADYSSVVEEDVPMENVPKWFLGSTLNYAENCLKNGADADVAFIEADAAGAYVKYTYARLRRDVRSLAGFLHERLAVGAGDHVCGYLPNLYGTAVAMLAAATLGAVWASCSTDFGPTGVLDRFAQVAPKVLFVVAGARYKGREHSLVANVDEVVAGLAAAPHLVQVTRDAAEAAVRSAHGPFARPAFSLAEVLRTERAAPFRPLPFHHPLCVLFSSGTTGPPKGIVHTVGGVLLKHVEEHIVQNNMSRADTIFFYTTCGWMMWNWLMSVLFAGAAIVLYADSPLDPPDVLLRIASDTGATVLGMGARIYDEYAKSGVDYKSRLDLSRLRLVLSTASPLKAATFRYLNARVRPRVPIGSIAGGTELVGCFMGGTLNRAVVAGECQHLLLGMCAAALDAAGRAVLGAPADLVCRRPFPSMPLRLVGDADGARYRAAYFAARPGLWTHGDLVLFNPRTHGCVVFGRSDTTLNRGGVRIGTAEIYNVVEKMDEVSDSLVVGVRDPKDAANERMLLFLKLEARARWDESLVARVKTALRSRMSPRHVPDRVLPVADLPYTSSGKKVELAVKQVLQGDPVKNKNSLRNPEALLLFEQFRETE